MYGVAPQSSCPIASSIALLKIYEGKEDNGFPINKAKRMPQIFRGTVSLWGERLNGHVLELVGVFSGGFFLCFVFFPSRCEAST